MIDEAYTTFPVVSRSPDVLRFARPGFLTLGRAVMTRFLVALLALVALAAGAEILAHHSFAATYIENKSVTIEGELVQFLLRNPHSFVHINVKERDGSIVRYVVEWGSAGQLGNQGVNRDSLKPGDHVIIKGNPGRNPEDHRVRLLSFHRPKDGWTWGLLPKQVVE